MGEGIGGGPLGTQELDLMTPFGSLATQIFYDFMISSSVISFNTILFYLALYYDVEGKQRKTPKQAVASPKMSLLGVLKPTLVIF